ncbi:hypothetical protein JTE90_017057 [Oedothorax gibbosus]|uniref:Uncharacterized protein n=1 Tax=Oedothorax gibbosus TaxID=931172 RepID=A0AAV6UMS2_9ARAC|nr:hypothetical protein JTE90_017057 [Oedothorax gibbosus]
MCSHISRRTKRVDIIRRNSRPFADPRRLGQSPTAKDGAQGERGGILFICAQGCTSPLSACDKNSRPSKTNIVQRGRDKNTFRRSLAGRFLWRAVCS